MNRPKQLSQGLGLMLVTLLLISCGVSSVSSVAPTATPTAKLSTPTSTPEPPAPTPTPTERQEPKDRSEVPRISPEDLKERLDNGEGILVVDSRAKTSFDYRHIAGAISVPEDEVESRLGEFPRDQEIVFYCT